MDKCIMCGSYAINHRSHGRDGSDPDLCDVCYWRKRADAAAEVEREVCANTVEGLVPRDSANWIVAKGFADSIRKRSNGLITSGAQKPDKSAA